MIRSKGKTLGLLNHLLVDRSDGVVHYNSAIRFVNLGVHLCVLDEVRDPLLALLLRQVETGGELLDVDALVDSAVQLRNQVSGRFQEGVCEVVEEEVIGEDGLGLEELGLGLGKVVVNVKGTDKVSDGVLVLVKLLANDADKVLESALVVGVVAALGVEGDDGGGEVADDPRAGGLDCGDVGSGEKEIDETLLVEVSVLE